MNEGRDYTLPGHSYMGPGTKVITNLLNNLKPTDDVDKAAFEHDIDYVMAEDYEDIIAADDRFAQNAPGVEGYLASKLIGVKNSAKHIANMFDKDPSGYMHEPSAWTPSPGEFNAISDLIALRKSDFGLN